MIGNRWASWIRNCFRRDDLERDLDAEISAHVQLLADEQIALDVEPQAARRQALVAMGGVEHIKDEVREARTGQWLDQLWQDVRYGVRMLRRSPGFAALAVITVALGIGANTAMFSVIDTVVLQPPPFGGPAGVMFVWQKQPNGKNNAFSTPDYLEWKRQQGLAAGMAAYTGSSRTLGTRDGAERIAGGKISSEMLAVLDVAPVLGRPFSAAEDIPGAGSYVLLSDALWKTRFASDRNIVGSKIRLDGAPYTVTGVMPAGFYILGNTERFWEPLQLQTQDAAAASRAVHWIFALARLDQGSTIKRSQSQLDAAAARLHHDDPNGDAGFGVNLQLYQDAATDGLRQPLALLMGCVGLVLLIACSNVANLLLARGTARRMEMSVRAALGARRSRVVRQLLTESVLLAFLGGVFGLLMATAALKVLAALHPSSLPGVETIAINRTVLGFTMAICLGVGVLFGIMPAWAASRPDLSNALRQSARGDGRSAGRHRLALVIAETALASVLLIGAVLSLKSLWKVSQVDPGLNPNGLLTFKVSAPARAKDKDQPYVFYQRVAERVRALPGVQSACLARNIPLSGTDPSMPVGVDGHPPQVVDGQVVTRLRVIGPDYFHAFQTPMLRGREFTVDDSPTSQPVVVVSQSLAQRYWPGADPLGKTLKPNMPEAPWYFVVGVAADVRHQGLDADIEPTAYYPYTQIPKSVLPLVEREMTVVVRAGKPAGLTDSVRSAVAEVDKTVPIFLLQSVNQMLSDAGSLRRFDMWLLAAFAGLALTLAAVGVYGVMAYSVSQRTREIGIRMALGASRPAVFRVIIGQGAKLALAGAAVGAVGAFFLTRLMASLLYQVSPTDVATFLLVSITVMVCILLACYIPSRRAMRVDPNVALRHE